MKKIRSFIISVLFITCGFIFGACGTTAIASQDYPLKIWKHNENGAYKERDGDKYVEFKAINVGCMLDYMSFTPRTLKELLEKN